MSPLYSTKVTAIGGRSGTVRSEDGLFALSLALPTTMGGKGGATNPEQLFAAGYAACFENAVIHVTRDGATKVKDTDIVVVAEVGLSPNSSGGFVLSVALDVPLAARNSSNSERALRPIDTRRRPRESPKPSTSFEREPPMHNSWQQRGLNEEPCAYQAVRAVPSAYERHDETCAARGLTMMTQFPG